MQKSSVRKKLYHAIKRVFDVVVSIVALIVLSPVFILAAIAVLIEDGANPFYVQERIGKGEKVFRMYKFRSMKINSEAIHAELKEKYGEEDISFKPKDDPRITKVGRILRRTSIDELPQLINIIKGDMSIVGPRPLPVYEYEDEREQYGLEFKERYEVLQGLTCYWQVDGRSEEMPFYERMGEDVKYAREASMLVDLKIILKTFGVVISGKGAF